MFFRSFTLNQLIIHRTLPKIIDQLPASCCRYKVYMYCVVLLSIETLKKIFSLFFFVKIFKISYYLKYYIKH